MTQVADSRSGTAKIQDKPDTKKNKETLKKDEGMSKGTGSSFQWPKGNNLTNK